MAESKRRSRREVPQHIRIEDAYDLVSRMPRNPLAVRIGKPVHLACPTAHPERVFDGKPRRWCSGCDSPEGCVVCTLD